MFEPGLGEKVAPAEDLSGLSPTETPIQPSALEPPLSTEMADAPETPPLRELKKPDVQSITSDASAIVDTTISKKLVESRKGKSNDTPYTSAEKSMSTYVFFKSHMTNPSKEFTPFAIPPDQGEPLSFRYVNGKYEACKDKGQKLTAMTGKQIVNGDVFFSCTFENMQNDVLLPASEVLKAQLLAESDNIIPAIENDAQKKVASEYINTLLDPTVDIALTSADIEAGAKKTGFLSSKAAYELISQAELSSVVKEELISTLDGSSIASPEALGKILHSMNNFETSYASKKAQAEDIEGTLKELDIKIQAVTKGSPLEQKLISEKDYLQIKLISIKAELPGLEELSKAAAISESDYVNLIKGVYETPDNEASIAKLESAMTQGDLKNLAKELLGVIPTDHKDFNKYKDMVDSAIQYGSVAVIALVAIIVMEATKNMGG